MLIKFLFSLKILTLCCISSNLTGIPRALNVLKIEPFYELCFISSRELKLTSNVVRGKKMKEGCRNSNKNLLEAWKGNFQDFHELMGIKVSEITEVLTEKVKLRRVLFLFFFFRFSNSINHKLSRTKKEPAKTASLKRESVSINGEGNWLQRFCRSAVNRAATSSPLTHCG